MKTATGRERVRHPNEAHARGGRAAANLRHGESERSKTQRATGEYRAWCAMNARCCVPSNRAYPNYGAKGVTVCSRWRESYEAFLADMGRKPSDGHSLDRIDNSKGYEPGNCRWATLLEQARNKSNNRWLSYHGEVICATDLAMRAGISIQLLCWRLKSGMSAEEAADTPRRLTRKKEGT